MVGRLGDFIERRLLKHANSPGEEALFVRKCPERVVRKKNNKKLTHMITPKEKEILQLIADGLSSKQIAEKLNISFYTVQTHRKNMLAKMGVKNTPELIVKLLSQAA